MHAIALKQTDEREMFLYDTVLEAIERSADYLFLYQRHAGGEKEFASLVETNVKQCLVERVERRVHDLYGERRINQELFETDRGDFTIGYAIEQEMKHLRLELESCHCYLCRICVQNDIAIPGLFSEHHANVRGGGFRCGTSSS